MTHMYMYIRIHICHICSLHSLCVFFGVVVLHATGSSCYSSALVVCVLSISSSSKQRMVQSTKWYDGSARFVYMCAC
jgi:hypothetical protein